MFSADRRSFLFQMGALAVTPMLPVLRNQEIEKPLDVERFARLFGGEIRRPGSAEFTRLSVIMQGKDNKHPAAFAHCASTADVQRAVAAAREMGVYPGVRGGGHSYAGHALVDRGLVIDLSGLQGVEIAPDNASVTVGGGALLGMIDRATGEIGKATTFGQCPTVGVSGFALGGGVGALMGRMGLGCDNLIAAEIVLADGRAVVAGPEDDADLFWAIRGGGGNFGVATSLTFRLQPIAEVTAGALRLRSENSADMLLAYDAFAAQAPADLTLISTLAAAPDGPPVLTIDVCHCGTADQADRDLADLAASPHLMNSEVRRMSYPELQSSGPQEPFTIASECRGGFRDRIDAETARGITEALGSAPGPAFASFLPLHGAVTTVEPTATAFPLRQRGLALSLMAMITDPTRRSTVKDWADAFAEMYAQPGAGAYANTMDVQGPAAVRMAYADNYARLAQLKAKYDPDNLFRGNQNILPAAAA